jgi:SAM-dependent methyltransferase
MAATSLQAATAPQAITRLERTSGSRANQSGARSALAHRSTLPPGRKSLGAKANSSAKVPRPPRRWPRARTAKIAQQAAPGSRVVYVDNDPVAVLHSQAILARNDYATAIQADLRQPRQILDHPELRDLLDLSRPVALLLVAVLHFLPDGDGPAGLVAELRDALAPGSRIVISHGTTDAQPAHVAEAMRRYAQTTAPFRPRSHAGILAFFDGFTLIPPDLVPVPRWRPAQPPDDAGQPEPIAAYGGAGIRP